MKGSASFNVCKRGKAQKKKRNFFFLHTHVNTCSISFSCVSIEGEFNQREQQCHPSSAAPIMCGRQRPASPHEGTWGDERNLTGKAKDWKVFRTKLMLVNNEAIVFFFCFLLINERIACNGTWTMLARRFHPFEPFLNVRTVLTMHVYIALCRGPKAASIAWWTCIHVIISSDVAPCVEIPFFSLFKCLALYLKSPYLFLFLFFLHPVLISAPFSSCTSQSWVTVIMEVRWKTLTPSFSHVLSPSYWKLKAVFHLWSAPWGVILTIIFSLLLFSMPLSPSARPLHTLVNVWVFFFIPSDPGAVVETHSAVPYAVIGGVLALLVFTVICVLIVTIWCSVRQKGNTQHM